MYFKNGWVVIDILFLFLSSTIFFTSFVVIASTVTSYHRGVTMGAQGSLRGRSR